MKNNSKTILIIGAGKIGTSLYRAIKEKTVYPVKLYDIKYTEEVERNLISPSDKLDKLSLKNLNNIHLIFICTQDDAIESAIKQLEQFELSEKYVIHTAGCYDSGILIPLKLKGAKTGSLHPMQTFERRYSDAEIWKDIICSYEGSVDVFEELQILCKQLGAHIIRVNPDQKIALHLAGVITANYLVGLIAWAEKILKESKIADIEYSDLLNPLMQKTLDNYKRNDVGKILTGPISRGDINTINNHLAYLDKNPDELHRDLYKLIAEIILKDARFKIKNRETLIQLFEKL